MPKPKKEQITIRVLPQTIGAIIAYCDGLSGGSEKYTTVRQCAARMMGIAARRQKSLTILTIDGLAEKLDALLTRNDGQTK